MRLLTLVLAAAGVQLAAAAAVATTTTAPVTTAKPSSSRAATTTKKATKTSSTTSACPEYKTTTIKFDNLKPGQDVGTVGDYSFSGFTVQTGEYAGIKASSGKNVAMADQYGAYISGGLADLRALSFACVNNYPLGFNFEADCKIKIVTSLFHSPIGEYGPYNYTADFSKFDPSDHDYAKYFPLTKVRPGLGGGWWGIFITDGEGGSQMVFDNIEMVTFNDCPQPSG